MTARKIVIQGCGECQHRARSWVRCEHGNCALKGRIVPETGIPDWCPLPKDANELAMASPPSVRYVGPDAADEYRAAKPGINPEHESFVMFMRGWEVRR